MGHFDGEVALNSASHCSSAALSIGSPVQTRILDRLLIVLIDEVLGLLFIARWTLERLTSTHLKASGHHLTAP